MFRDEAYILRRYDFSETSQIASVLTREHGRRRVLAKGARAERRKGQGARGLDLFCRLGITLYPKSSDALDLLGEWEALEFHGRIRADLDRIEQALYLLEFLDQVCPEDEPVPEVFDVLRGTLERLPSGRRGVGFFAGLLRLLGVLGYAAPAAACVACGRDPAGRAPLRFAPGEGGILCRDCRPEAPRSFVLSAGAARLLAVLEEEDPGRLGLSAAQAAEIWRCLSAVVREVTERRLRLEGSLDRIFALARPSHEARFART